MNAFHARWSAVDHTMLNFLKKKPVVTPPQNIQPSPGFSISHIPQLPAHTSLDELFDHRNSNKLEVFYLFAIAEFSAENILCFFAIEDYKRLPTKAKQDFIMHRFINPGSDFEINIPAAIIKPLKQQATVANTIRTDAVGRRGAFVTANRMPVPAPSSFIFRDVQLNLTQDLSDTLSRCTAAHSTAFPRNDELLKVQLFATNMLQTGFSIPYCLRSPHESSRRLRQGGFRL